MKNKGIFGMLAIFVIGLTMFIAPVSAFAGRGFGQNEEIHEAIEAGNFEAWKEAHENLLTGERFSEVSERHANREQNYETREIMEEAIENDDYESWLDAAESLDHYPVDVETITEADFETLVEMHKAKQLGDFEIVHDFAEELGFERPMHGQGKGFRGQGMRMNVMN